MQENSGSSATSKVALNGAKPQTSLGPDNDLQIVKDILSLDLISSTLGNLNFNTNKSNCPSCNMAHYENFDDYKCSRLVEGIQSRVKQIRQMRSEKLNSVNLTLQTGDKKCSSR
jgi:hypothetical protein